MRLRFFLLGPIALALAQSSAAETMSSALSRAYMGNPDLNQQRASVRATDENLPRALSIRSRASGGARRRRTGGDRRGNDRGGIRDAKRKPVELTERAFQRWRRTRNNERNIDPVGSAGHARVQRIRSPY